MNANDQVLVDLKAAVRALDQLPNTLSIQGPDGNHLADVDVATVSAQLGTLVRVLELEVDIEHVRLAKMAVRKARIALNLGDTEAVALHHREVQRHLMAVEGRLL